MSTALSLVLHALEAGSHITDVEFLEFGDLSLWKVALDGLSYDCVIN